MSKYDLASAGSVSSAAALARIRAAQEPDQSSYNAAWLHGYADGLARAVDLLESQQEFLAELVDCIKEQYGSAGSYKILHDARMLELQAIPGKVSEKFDRKRRFSDIDALFRQEDACNEAAGKAA